MMKGHYYDDDMGDADLMFCPPQQYDECPDNPDLLLLRDAAVDERKAIAEYLEAALKTCLDELFLDVAEDEMQHFMKTMCLIAALDPVQARMLREEKLDMRTMQRPAGKANLKAWLKNLQEEDAGVTPPSKQDLCTIKVLTKALAGELHAINKYQEYMSCAQDEDVAALFCELMNEEKEHVAEFTAALFQLTNEPLPEEKGE